MSLRQGIAFAVFCLLAGSRWLVDAAYPETVPPLLAQSFHFIFLGIIALMFLLLRVYDGRVGKAAHLRVAAVSLLLFAAPTLLVQMAAAIRPETNVALYALVPICIVGVVAFTHETARTLMMPTLSGLAGALLILPWRLPSNASESVSFGEVLLAVLLTAAASVWMHSLLRSKQLAPVLIVIAFGNAMPLGMIGFARGERLPLLSSLGPELLRTLLIDLPQIFLLLWLLREVPPERYAARFFFIPFVTILEGLAVLRGTLDLRMAAGMLLLLYGAGSLMFARLDPAPRLDLR